MPIPILYVIYYVFGHLNIELPHSNRLWKDDFTNIYDLMILDFSLFAYDTIYDTKIPLDKAFI